MLKNSNTKYPLFLIFLFSVLSYSFSAIAESTDDRLIILEKKVKELEKKNSKLEKKTKKKDKYLAEKIKRNASRIKTGGFISFGIGKTDEESPGFNNKFDYRKDAIVGVQTSYQLDSNTRAVVQLVAEGEEDYDPEIRWAYVQHRLTDNIAIRGGRIKTPFYYYSETLDIGFTYPWVSPPSNIYSPSLSAFEGFDALVSFSNGEVNSRLQIALGGMKENLDDLVIEGSKGYLINLETSYGPFIGRLGASISPETNVQVEGIGENEFPVDFYDAAFVYEGERIMVLVEAIAVRVDASDQPLLGNEELYLGLVSYRFDHCRFVRGCSVYFSQGVNYSTSETDGASAKIGDLVLAGYHEPFKETRTNLGLRLELTPKIAMKLEVEKQKTNEFSSNQGALDTPEEGVFAYSLVFDAIF